AVGQAPPKEVAAVDRRTGRLETHEGPDVVLVVADVPDDDFGVMVVRDGGCSAGARMIVVCGIVEVRKGPVVLLELHPVWGHGGERLPGAALGERVFLTGEAGGCDRVGSKGDAREESRQGKAAQKSSRTALTQCALDEVHGSTPVFSALAEERRWDGDPARARAKQQPCQSGAAGNGAWIADQSAL